MSNEHLIARHLQGDSTPAEAAALAAWRLSAPENDEEYRTLAALWTLVGTASPINEDVVPPSVDVIVAVAEEQDAEIVEPQVAIAIGRRAPGQRQLRDPGSWGRPFLLGLLAASVAFVGIGLGILADRFGSPAADEFYRTVATGDHAGATLTLYDGTAVRLAPSSELRVLQAGDHPIVQLSGRAYFGVVPDPSRTFTVQTEYGDATALGTRFEVRTDQRELEVLVVQGNVRVSAAGSSVEIGEGMMTRGVDGVPLYTSRVNDMDARLSWLGQALFFRATPLTQVVTEIATRYNVEITLDTPSLGNLEVTAIFTDQPVGEVVFVVCRIVGARCALTEGRYRIGVADDATGILQADSSVQLR